jgi:hypothetical protein
VCEGDSGGLADVRAVDVCAYVDPGEVGDARHGQQVGVGGEDLVRGGMHDPPVDNRGVVADDVEDLVDEATGDAVGFEQHH